MADEGVDVDKEDGAFDVDKEVEAIDDDKEDGDSDSNDDEVCSRLFHGGTSSVKDETLYPCCEEGCPYPKWIQRRTHVCDKCDGPKHGMCGIGIGGEGSGQRRKCADVVRCRTNWWQMLEKKTTTT